MYTFQIFTGEFNTKKTVKMHKSQLFMDNWNHIKILILVPLLLLLLCTAKVPTDSTYIQNHEIHDPNGEIHKCVCVCVCVCARARARACAHVLVGMHVGIFYSVLLLTCFSYDCNLFKCFFLLKCFVHSRYIDGIFKSKFPFKDNKALSYKVFSLLYLQYRLITATVLNRSCFCL